MHPKSHDGRRASGTSIRHCPSARSMLKAELSSYETPTTGPSGR